MVLNGQPREFRHTVQCNPMLKCQDIVQLFFSLVFAAHNALLNDYSVWARPMPVIDSSSGTRYSPGLIGVKLL